MIYVTRAIVIRNHSVLTAQRPASMSLSWKWELPGGKMEAGETPADCLIRETQEELGLDIAVNKALPHVDRVYNGKHYRMLPFVCSVVGGEMEVFEHHQAGWWPLHKLFDLDWAPAEKLVMEAYVKAFPVSLVEAGIARVKPVLLPARITV